MNKSIFILVLMITSFSFAQEKEDVKAIRKANNYVYEGNTLLADKDDFVSAEMAYRKAISEQPNTTAGIYNLANSYYKTKNYEEAFYRLEQAAKNATSKDEKHKAFHNMGNVLMENKKCKEAVEAYKNALRNDPTDEETRYNLGLAKICAEQQKDQNKDDQNKDDKDKKDQDKKDDKDKGDNKDDNKDKGDKDKKEGDDKKDEDGKPKDEKDNKGKGDEDKKDQQQPKPQPGQLSPQQIKNILEAMNNQEQKVQEKVNAEKQKGVKVKTDKDW
ncbi:tetratricopeptide repeat protein [Confluentibacter sediminis]|uniref:tetratricopeptide repeat protein n=1 Tax=Confluentibacter sediminis TaxID=2219045 RepID=UPI000DADFB00|nr:tetratricopeptide repeat protein [Confluentibacter sediminis]